MHRENDAEQDQNPAENQFEFSGHGFLVLAFKLGGHAPHSEGAGFHTLRFAEVRFKAWIVSSVGDFCEDETASEACAIESWRSVAEREWHPSQKLFAEDGTPDANSSSETISAITEEWVGDPERETRAEEKRANQNEVRVEQMSHPQNRQCECEAGLPELKCSREMRIVSLIDQEDVIERILRHLGLWQEGVRVHSGTDPPGETTPSIRGSTTPSPTTTPNRSWRSPPAETSGSARVRLSHPLFSGPKPSGGSFFRGAGAPRNPKKPVFDFRAHFCHSAPMETHAFGFRLRANAPEGRFPIMAKSDFLSVKSDFLSVSSRVLIIPDLSPNVSTRGNRDDLVASQMSAFSQLSQLEDSS